MSFSVTLLVTGCVLGVVQLAAGIALGMWLRRPDATSRDTDLRRARSLALELHGLTQRIGGQVAQHRTRFEAAGARLGEVPTGKRLPTTDLVVGVVGEILAANRQLQSELMAAEKQLAEQAREIESHLTRSLTDPLTSLPNRRALDEQLATRLHEYRKQGSPYSLLMLDVDHFKQINDTFGHPVGDEVLVHLGSAFRETLRKHDFVARYGGEEFAIVFPHTTLDEAVRAARHAAAAAETLSGQFDYFSRPLTVSGGLATIQPGEDVESLLRRADDALYMAKHHGRDCTYLHDGHACRELVVPASDGAAGRKQSSGEHAAADQAATGPAEVGECSETLLAACGELRAAMAGAASANAVAAAESTP